VVIGALFTTFSAGFVGEGPLMLLGRRLSLPVNWTSSELVIELFSVVASVSGRETRLLPNLPIPPLAISLPRCGVQTKENKAC
jgi:hypothetical protein